MGPSTVRDMVRKLYSSRPILLLAGMVVLSGCELAKSHVEDWSSIPEIRKPVASRALYSHEVLFSPSEASLNDSEGRRLQGFIDNAKIGASDRVYLVSGDSLFGKLRVQAIGKFLETNNIRVRPLPADIGVGGPSGDAISVVVSRYVVTLPACPDWTGERYTYNNVPTSNWGCATAINLGRMVARPEDLVRGRDPGTFDGEYATRSIDLYRKGETKPLTQESIGPVENKQQSGSQSSSGGGG